MLLPSGIQTNYTYNSDGQLEQVKNGNETVVYIYDEMGNTNSVVRNAKTIKTYGYTTESNLLAKYTLGLFTQSYGYDDLDHIQLSVDDQVLHDYQSDVNVKENKTTLTLNTDLWQQVTQMNDANLLGSLTYTTKSQQPFKIGYNYTKGGMLKMSQERNVLLQSFPNLRRVDSVARLIQLTSSKQQFITNHRGDVLIEEHRLSSAPKAYILNTLSKGKYLH